MYTHSNAGDLYSNHVRKIVSEIVTGFNLSLVTLSSNSPGKNLSCILIPVYTSSLFAIRFFEGFELFVHEFKQKNQVFILIVLRQRVKARKLWRNPLCS